MTSKKKSKRTISAGAFISVCLMILCLTFLTALNFFIYSSDNKVMTQTSPSGPTEEKTSNAGFSIVEEILHESSFEFSSQLFNQFCLHHIAAADSLLIFHPELIIRPPRA